MYTSFSIRQSGVGPTKICIFFKCIIQPMPKYDSIIIRMVNIEKTYWLGESRFIMSLQLVCDFNEILKKPHYTYTPLYIEDRRQYSTFWCISVLFF